MKKQDTYFPTLSGAVDHAVKGAEAKGFTPNTEDIFRQFGTGGIFRAETRRGSISLSKDGKESIKALQISIYRLESGTYELTHYIN